MNTYFTRISDKLGSQITLQNFAIFFFFLSINKFRIFCQNIMTNFVLKEQKCNFLKHQKIPRVRFPISNYKWFRANFLMMSAWFIHPLKQIGSNSYIVKLHEKLLPPLPFRTRKSLKKGCSVVVVATAEEVMLATVEVAGFTTPLPKH